MINFKRHRKGKERPPIPNDCPVEERLMLAAENRGIELPEDRLDFLLGVVESTSSLEHRTKYIEGGINLRVTEFDYFAGVPSRQLSKNIRRRLAIAYKKGALYNLDFTPTTDSKGICTTEPTRGEVSDIVLGGLHALQNHGLLVDIGEYDAPVIIGNSTNHSMASLAIKRLGFEKVWSDGIDDIVIVDYPDLQEHLFSTETARYEEMLQKFQTEHEKAAPQSSS